MKVCAIIVLLPLMPVPGHGELNYKGGEGPGKGKHIVFATGDDQYRSEEGMPMLARILATRHGFRCTVLFRAHRQANETKLDPSDSIPGIEALDRADLLILFTRFLYLPDNQMKHIVDYVESGRPVVALRTATHAFSYPADSP